MIFPEKNVDKMATGKLKRFFYFSIFLVVILSLVLPLINSQSLPHRFDGTQITIGSNTSTNGSFVAAYINGVMKANCTAGIGLGCVAGAVSWARTPFLLSVEGNPTNTIIITVYNVTANDTSTFIAGSRTSLNLTISQLSNTAVCAYSEACSGGYCCNKATEYHGTGIGACQARACTVIPSIINPRNVTYSASTTLDFNISLNDAGSSCNFTLDSGASTSMTKFNTTWFGYTKTGLTSGSHTLLVSCNDTDNDFNSTSTLAFGLDLVANVSLISPDNATSTTTAAQVFQCNASDPQQINNVTFYLYDSSNSSLVNINSTAVVGTYNQTNFSYTIPYTGTFLWNCKANDTLGNVSWASNNRTITISAVTTTTTTTTESGGGGGGGGGAVTAEASQSKYSGVVNAGSTKEITYTKEELKITGITITAATQIDNAGITVKESTASKAGIAISAGEGSAYKYLEITKSLVTDEQISKAKISFKVEKSWYSNNNYDVATTVLRRKVGDAWQDLPTIKLKEDVTYYYFDAESTGLSYFAVIAKKIGAVIVPPTEKKAVCGDAVCEFDETCSSCIADCACGTGKECVDNACKEKAVVPAEKEKMSKTKLMLIGIGILIVLAIIIILLAMPKKKKDLAP